MTIDMKDFSGETFGSDAESQQIDQNSYLQETHPEETPVNQEILQDVQFENAPQEIVAVKEPTAQELNFKALREEIDRIKAEREAERNEFRQNIDLLRANSQTHSPQKEVKKVLDNLSDHDVPTAAEIRQAFEQRESQYLARLEELEVQQAHPDYAEVLEKYTAPLLKQKPHLAEGILGSRNKALYAYELGKMAQNMNATSATATQTHATAQKIVENAKKPGNFAQVGGQSVLSKADYYATMSDTEFMKMAAKNLGEI